MRIIARAWRLFCPYEGGIPHQKLSRVIRRLSVSDMCSASYPAIRSTDPSSYTCDADAPNRMATSLVL